MMTPLWPWEVIWVLTIISTPQGRFVYWKGFEPAELLDDSHLVADDDITPFRYTH